MALRVKEDTLLTCKPNGTRPERDRLAAVERPAEDSLASVRADEESSEKRFRKDGV